MNVTLPIPATADAQRSISSLSPKALALLCLARSIGVLQDSKSSSADLLSWLRSLPSALEGSFTGAMEELHDLSPLSILAHVPKSNLAIDEQLASLVRKEKDAGTVKAEGMIFTPNWLANRMVKNLQHHWIRLHGSGKRPRNAADVSCGVGVFLNSLSTHFGPDLSVLGADTDALCVDYARLWGWATNQAWDIKQEDSLASGRSQLGLANSICTWPTQFDILVGNPPYVRSPSLEKTYVSRLRNSYRSTSAGNFDLSVAFLEHAINNLAEGGIAAYVVTNKFMTAVYGEEIRRQLATKVRLLNVEDFQDYQVFEGRTTYTSVLTFAKSAPSKRFSVTYFPKGVIANLDPGRGESITLSREQLSSPSWHFTSNETEDILRLMRSPQNPLLTSVIGRVVQGLRTGANDVFVVPTVNDTKIEKGVLVPFVTGEQVRRLRVNDKALALIYPYEPTIGGQPRLLSEYELRDRYPQCWAYLNAHKVTLEERSRDDNGAFYGYSRSQNLNLVGMRKVLVREMMPRADFAPDVEGRLAFASGYAVDASGLAADETFLWSAILSTPTMEFFMRHQGTQLQNGWFRLLKHHLLTVRVPRLEEAAQRAALTLARKLLVDSNNESALEQLDRLVADSFGLTSSQRTAITKELERSHVRSMPRNSKETNDLSRYEPVRLERFVPLHRDQYELAKLVTFVENKNTPIHRWYRFTQGYSSKLVTSIVRDLSLAGQDVVLDPFLGCGTTSLTCRQLGIQSIGFDVSPLLVWASSVKSYAWDSAETRVLANILQLPLPSPSECAGPDYTKCLFPGFLKQAFAPRVAAQLWTYAAVIDSVRPPSIRCLLKLGLVSIMEDVSRIRKHGSHYRFMNKPESLGLEKVNIPVVADDIDIRPVLRERWLSMIDDINNVAAMPHATTGCQIGCADARSLPLANESVTAIITSPPYLNRNNYIAQQKAELAILGLVTTERDYRELVRRTLCSHVDGVVPKSASSAIPEVDKIVRAMELSAGNNSKILNMVAGYFQDMAIVMRELSRVLKPGGTVAMVVGNCRWGGIMVPVDHLLLMLGELAGLRPERVLVTRLKGNSPQQMRWYGRLPARESVILLSKPKP